MLTIKEGDVFDTPFETGCVVTNPKLYSFTDKAFLALDSENVECQFSLDMIIAINGKKV